MLQLLKISRFQFNFSMIIPEIHLIFYFIFELILFDFTFNIHIGTTPASCFPAPVLATPHLLQASREEKLWLRQALQTWLRTRMNNNEYFSNNE